MSTIRAIVVDPTVEGRLKIDDVESPRPALSEALVRISAISLNLGEVRTTTRASAGWRPGWDLSGVVEQSAADGSGPPIGTRVFGMVTSGSWAELVAVPTNFLAEIPENVTFAQAATLPVAGLTALNALEKGGFLLNRKVLVTGASGGVGHFACQLAQQAGAAVTALVRREERAANLREMRINKVVIGEDVAAAQSSGPYDFIVDTLGGKSLVTVSTFLELDGRCVNVGAATEPEMTLQARLESIPDGVLVNDGIGNRLGVSKDLGRLVEMVAEGRLHPQVDREASWTEIAEVAQSLLNRRIAGKAVLSVS
ncbi:zinc-binding dehydrogenase [Paenibacillus sp. GP183]|uniref:zinc-binding dehydrogenase n=1 Tax=Paenibacillus sp. GP183 TaxID=1882751 RepID=UPI00089C4AEC|nr:zinc-binding dehydrogenase [Paenibacillus sp. GP183]SEC40458.1 NADPH:quinone reductase [Paenibacillus sp. GP183]